MVAAVDGDGVGVGLEECVEVGEGGFAVAPLEEAALAARGEDLWVKGQSAFHSGNQDKLLLVGNPTTIIFALVIDKQYRVTMNF